MSQRLCPLLLAVLLISSAVLASSEKPEIKIDVSGNWKWTMQRQNGGGREVRLKLEQQGEKLTGTISGMGFGGDADIQEGTFKDGKVSFKVTRTRGGTETITTYTGTLQGDSIKGKAETDTRGQKVPRDWEAQRVKEDPPKAEN